MTPSDIEIYLVLDPVLEMIESAHNIEFDWKTMKGGPSSC